MRAGSHLALLLALLFLAACAGDPAPQTDGEVHAGLREVPCWFSNAGANPAVCAWLRPERQDSNASTELPLVVLRESARQPSERVTIFLNGGPGGSSELDEHGLRTWRMRRARLELRHDLVLYDQRGAGRATPAIGCDKLDKAARHMFTADPERDHDRRVREFADAVAGCAVDKVPLADRRSALYSTETAVKDLAELITALRSQFGYQRVSLYGVSYGARLALMASLDPANEIDAMVLDSLYVPGEGGIVWYPDEFEALLDAFDQECLDYEDCALTDAGIRVPLRAALDHLEAAPLPAKAADPGGLGPRLPVSFDRHLLINALTTSLYLPEWMIALPAMLEDLPDAGIDERWQVLIDSTLEMNLSHGVNFVAFSLIECRDNERPDRQRLEAQLQRWPMFADILRPADWEYTWCDRLAVPAAPLPNDWRVEVPTLLLNMAVDPATPAYKVEAVFDRFDEAELMIVSGSGHGVLDYDEESAREAGWFLNDEPRPEPPWQPQMCPPPEGEPFTA